MNGFSALETRRPGEELLCEHLLTGAIPAPPLVSGQNGGEHRPNIGPELLKTRFSMELNLLRLLCCHREKSRQLK